MFLPVGNILRSQFRGANHKQVFGVLFLGRLGEVKATRYHRGPVDNHKLVVGNSVLGVDQGRDASMGDEICRRVFLATLAIVQNHPNVNATLMGIYQGLGNRGL